MRRSVHNEELMRNGGRGQAGLGQRRTGQPLASLGFERSRRPVQAGSPICSLIRIKARSNRDFTAGSLISNMAAISAVLSCSR